MKSQNILITGGSGLVGHTLTTLLQKNGFKVSWLSRSGKSIDNVKGYQWNVEKATIDKDAINWADAIIHLAGEGVASGRWTDAKKERILDSRVESTKLLCNAIKESDNQVQTFISASAIGYYGLNNVDKLLSESDKSGKDFLAEVTKQWEEEVDQITDLPIKIIKLRIGIVLSDMGGALEKMAQPIRWGLGAALGTGNQYMSWIHIADLCRMIHYLLEKNKSGIYNGVAPNPVTNKEVSRAIAHQLNKPFFFPNVPAFVLKIMIGEMSDILLGGSKVSSKKIEKEGFEFRFPTLELALEHLLR